MSRTWSSVLLLLVVASLVISGCSPAAPTTGPAPAAAAATPVALAPTAPPAQQVQQAAAPVVNSAGVTLPADAAPLDQQVLTQIVFPEPAHLDRSASVSASGSVFPFLISEPLVRLNENFELLPAGAESWEVAADNVTWTFHIRKGMQWSDGVPLTAQDYAYMYQRMADPKTAFDWGWFYADILNFSDIQAGKKPITDLGVKAVDDNTLQIVTKKPEPFFPLKGIMMVPPPKHIAEKDTQPGAWAASPSTAVSAGPFKLVEWTKGKQMVFQANKDYKGPFKPLLEKEVYLIGTAESVMPAYEAGQIDAVAYAGYNITPADVAKAKPQAAQAGLHFYTNFRSYYLPMDSTKPPFDNVKVRQAFAKALDRDALINSVMRDLGTPGYSMLPPGFPAANVDALKPLQQFDAAAAKQLLADAGYPDGKGFPTIDLYNGYPNNTTLTGICQAVQAQLKQVLNVNINVKNVEYSTYADMRSKGQLQLMLELYEYDYADPSNLLGLWAHQARYRWSNADFDKLMDQGDVFMGSQADRFKIYQDAEKVLVQDAGGAFLAYELRPQFWKPYIAGQSLQPNKTGMVAWRGSKLGLTDFTIYITKDVAKFRK